MTKSGVLATGTIFAATILLTLPIIWDRIEITRLRNSLAVLQAERHQFAASAEENRRPSSPLENVNQTPPPQEPSLEVLRLRGQVAQLHNDLEELKQRKQDGFFELAAHSSLMDCLLSYSAMGIA